MKRLSLLLVVVWATFQISSAQASGIIIESIKAHVEQHQVRQFAEQDRSKAQIQPEKREQLHPAQSVLAPWIQSWWDALVNL